MKTEQIILGAIALVCMSSVETTLVIFGHHTLPAIGLVGLIIVCANATSK